jgi:hypothetical protein
MNIDRAAWWLWLSACLLRVAIDFFREPKR